MRPFSGWLSTHLTTTDDAVAPYEASITLRYELNSNKKAYPKLIPLSIDYKISLLLQMTVIYDGPKKYFCLRYDNFEGPQGPCLLDMHEICKESVLSQTGTDSYHQ